MANEVRSPPEPNAAVPANGVLATEGSHPPEPTVTALVSGIITDAQQLIQQQFAMFRQEIHQDMGKLKSGALSLALGVGIAGGGGVLVLLMLPLLLYAEVPGLPLWACCGIVGAVLTALGAGVAYASVKKLESLDPLSDQSAKGLKENWQWTSNPK